MFRVGIIGCGGISAVHVQALRELDTTQLISCADVIPEQAARFGCTAYTDWREMLDREKPDAVHICTPHHLHPVMAAEAARRGIAVFTEKPPAIDRAGWEQVKEAARQVPTGICFQNRYHPHIRSCMRFLREGTYGGLMGIRAFMTWNRQAEYYASASWKGRWSTEGGSVMINQAIHTLDLMILFLGMPDQAEAAMRNHHLRGVIESEDTAEVYLRRGRIPALLFASNAYSQDAPVIIELHFEQAVIRLEGDMMTVIRNGERQVFTCASDPAPGRAYWGSGHKACIADFYHSIQEGTSYQNDPASCEATMHVLMDLYDQCRPGFNP